uniref:RanBP-type and C3HC4-type zinc finger-containing protein 1 n=1 Tax=Culex pipiens TaxID=7175 RepID=A0A8D8A0V1_CULPI
MSSKMKRSTVTQDLHVECPLCREMKPGYQKIKLNQCNHVFCKPCLKRYCTHYGSALARCPYENCDQLLDDVEKQNILYPTNPIVRSPPIPKQRSWKFWKWDKAEKDNDTSCDDQQITYESFTDSKLANSSQVLVHEKLSANNPEEATIAHGFSTLPETVSNAAGNSTMKCTEALELHDFSSITILDVSCVHNSESPNSSPAQNQLIHLCSSSENKQPKVWGAEARISLRRFITEIFHVVVDFMFLAIKADLFLNTDTDECVICREQISAYKGITFPYCSYWFCQTCLTKPSGSCHTNCTEDFVLLYSNSSIQNKICAIILDKEIWGLLLNLDDDLVPTQCNSYSEDLKIDNTYKNSNAVNLISFDSSSKRDIRGSNLVDSVSEVVLLRNTNPSACLKCNRSILVKKGVILRGCYHVLCDCCLIQTIMETLDFGVEVRCPMILEDNRWCKTIIQEREIKSLLTKEQYAKYERLCLQAAQKEFESTARCFKPNCKGWVIVEGYKDSFLCQVCGNENCLSCKAIHNGKSCRGYMMQMERNTSKKSEPATRCPSCKGTKTKAGVNNFIRCSQCKFVFSLTKH